MREPTASTAANYSNYPLIIAFGSIQMCPGKASANKVTSGYCGEFGTNRSRRPRAAGLKHAGDRHALVLG
jgi:hypothetical protein